MATLTFIGVLGMGFYSLVSYEYHYTPGRLVAGNNSILRLVSLTGNGDVQPCVLCLFTTVPELTSKQHIYSNIISKWIQLPGVRPVIFNDSTNAGLLEFAKSVGWRVLQVPKYHGGVPVFKHMYFAASEHFQECEFYGIRQR